MLGWLCRMSPNFRKSGNENVGFARLGNAKMYRADVQTEQENSIGRSVGRSELFWEYLQQRSCHPFLTNPSTLL